MFVARNHSQRNPQTRKNIGNQHRRASRTKKITGAFVPLPSGYIDKIPLRLLPMFLLLWSMGGGLPLTECYRVLAARLKRDIRTVQQYAYDLEKLGILKIDRRKIGPCRNSANTFSFPELVGFIEVRDHGEITVEKQVQNLNTNTTATREDARKDSYPLQQWEQSRSENNPPAMRRLYEENGRLQAENRSLRERFSCRMWRREQEIRLRAEALVGYNDEPETADKRLSPEELEDIRQLKLKRGYAV
jgi:hypothetical protein